MQYPAVHFCIFPVYLLVSYMCAQIRVWSCLVTDNFGLFTKIAVCKFLRGWRSYGLKPFYFVHCMYLYIFCSFLYGAMCHRSCYRSCAIEMSIIIILTGKLLAVRRTQHVHAPRTSFYSRPRASQTDRANPLSLARLHISPKFKFKILYCPLQS